MKAKSNILIISDMCGYGKVSAAVQMPILSYMGLDVFNQIGRASCRERV